MKILLAAVATLSLSALVSGCAVVPAHPDVSMSGTVHVNHPPAVRYVERRHHHRHHSPPPPRHRHHRH